MVLLRSFAWGLSGYENDEATTAAAVVASSMV
jgi:hypothetical protein